jgi:formylglycine-generating enzyme required for sulfatase activity
MTLPEARAFAALRSMRLPTPREWLFVAVGSSVTAYPWGPRRGESVCNTLGLGLGRLTAVGTFESGRAPTPGIYDLLGNAKEWVEGWVPAAEDVGLLPSQRPVPPGVDSALGGSYRDTLRETFGPATGDILVFNATSLVPEHRADDLGFRCVADAREYLGANAGRWGNGEAARARVAAVARRWADAVGPLQVKRVLDELAAGPEAPPGIAWLLEGVR